MLRSVEKMFRGKRTTDGAAIIQISLIFCFHASSPCEAFFFCKNVKKGSLRQTKYDII